MPQHTELAWVFNAFAAYGDLTRMTQFKDKSGRTKHVSAGLFTYPVLQAADILLYQADAVPVGEDQAQHLELTRGIARRFNQVVGQDYFPDVQILLTEGKRIMSLADPDKKMSKSQGEKHYVGLMESPKRIAKKIKSAVTDVGGEARDELSPGVENLLGLLRLTGDTAQADEFRDVAQAGGLLYGHLKVAVADAVVAMLEPIQQRRAELSDDDVREILADGARRATDIAAPVMDQVRSLIGVGPGQRV